MDSSHDLSALRRAISNPPAVPGVRGASDLVGLDRRSVRPGDLMANSVAVIAPSASALSVPFVLQFTVGPGAWLSAVLGFALAFLLSSVFSQFATRIAASGSMYTWVTRSLGPLPGLVVGTSMLMGYGSLVAFGISQTVRKAGDSHASLTDGSGSGAAGQWAIAVTAVLACLLISIRGVRVSTRLAFVVEAALVAAVVLLVVTSLVRTGLPSASMFSLEGADPWRIVLGAMSIMGITVAFESSAALAGEAERPFLSVPRALVGSLVVAAVLYLLTMIAAAGAEPGRQRGPVERWFPPGTDVHLADAGLSALLAVSFFALALCAWNSLARVIFSLAREGLLPAVFGRTHERWSSPVYALVAVVPVSLLPVTASLLLGNPVGTITRELLQSAVLVLVIAYALVSVSLPFFLREIDEWTIAPVVVAVLAGTGTVVVAGLDTFEDIADGRIVQLVLVAVTLVTGLAWFLWLRAHRRRALRRMGIHDETISSDLLGG